MKKSLTNQKSKKAEPTVLKFDRKRVLRAFKDSGYLEDFRTEAVIVLRNTSFPFQRVTIPNNESISVNLVKCYLADLNLNFRDFMRKVNA